MFMFTRMYPELALIVGNLLPSLISMTLRWGMLISPKCLEAVRVHTSSMVARTGSRAPNRC